MSPGLLVYVLLTVSPAENAPPEQRAASIRFVRELQQLDGGFASARGPGGAATSSLRATSAALRALRYLGGRPKNSAGCDRFVRSCFDPAAGGFADAPGRSANVIATAIGLMALAERPEPPRALVNAAVRYLALHAESVEDIRMAAAGLEAVQERPPQAAAWLRRLAALRNPDGSFGHGPSSARDTAGGVVTWLRLGGRLEQRDAVLRALRSGQHRDGGFGAEANRSDLESTYRVARAFHMLRARPPDGDACRDFIDRCRNPDGGYGPAPGQPSQMAATYFAMAILHWLEKQ